jgi:hypothetical protein
MRHAAMPPSAVSRLDPLAMTDPANSLPSAGASGPQMARSLTAPQQASPRGAAEPSEPLTAWYRHADAMRSRSVGAAVLAGHVMVPAPPARLLADWARDIADRLVLQPGDVESLSLPRARVRWPGYGQCVGALAEWLAQRGLPDVLQGCDVALMACRGARYHHDGALYAGSAFCNLFLSEDRGLDVHFPGTGQRIPLVRGTVLLFDTGQRHAVIDRTQTGFDPADFPPDSDREQVFLTWELPIDQPEVARALGVRFEVLPAGPSAPGEEGVWCNGVEAEVCPASGRWLVSSG